MLGGLGVTFGPFFIISLINPGKHWHLIAGAIGMCAAVPFFYVLSFARARHFARQRIDAWEELQLGVFITWCAALGVLGMIELVRFL